MQAGWEHFDHGADIGVRGHGPTESAAFEQAAMALTAVITDPGGVAARQSVPLGCEAADDELLLAAWLNALVFEMAVRRMLFARFSVVIEDAPMRPGRAPSPWETGSPAATHVDTRAAGRRQLRAVAEGEPLDPARHHPAVEVKGATLTALRVAREGDGWLAQTVVDV